jgi:NO-binding membrane sensor protein with MHYT domain
MIPHHDQQENNIALLIASIIIQAGVWVTDMVAHITFTQMTEGTYQFLKISALIFSIWASWKVGKKHDVK